MRLLLRSTFRIFDCAEDRSLRKNANKSAFASGLFVPLANVMNETFSLFLWAMTVLALAVFVALHFVEAGPLALFILFQSHYLQRAFVFPLLIRGRSQMPLGIVLMGMVFNTLNALMQGGWIFYVSPAGYYDGWFARPYIWVGGALFIAGMVINLRSDRIIRHLRRPGDTRHYIPYGGMFRYVSSANYFGELLEWIGFAVASWSWAGAVFVVWTFANLAPRSASLYKRYEQEFGEEFTSLHRKRILPFIY